MYLSTIVFGFNILECLFTCVTNKCHIGLGSVVVAFVFELINKTKYNIVRISLGLVFALFVAIFCLKILNKNRKIEGSLYWISLFSVKMVKREKARTSIHAEYHKWLTIHGRWFFCLRPLPWLFCNNTQTKKEGAIKKKIALSSFCFKLVLFSFFLLMYASLKLNQFYI